MGLRASADSTQAIRLDPGHAIFPLGRLSAGVDFADAIAALEDLNRLEEIDLQLVYGEERIQVIGMARGDVLLVCIGRRQRPSGDCIIPSEENLQDISRKIHGGLKSDFKSVIPFAASTCSRAASVVNISIEECYADDLSCHDCRPGNHQLQFQGGSLWTRIQTVKLGLSYKLDRGAPVVANY